MDTEPSPSTPSAPSEVAIPSVPATEDDDIMAGTGLSAEDQQNAQASPADPSAPSPTTTEAPPPQEDRRKRVLGSADDKKRAKRLFGGLLGTLSSFKKEERERGASDAAKRRTLIADRIQNKLRVESTVLADIAAKERELKTLKIDLDRKENELTQKTAAFASRHASLPRLASFLHTASSEPTDSAPAGVRRNPAPLLQLSSAASASPSLPPLGQAAFHKSGDKVSKPLFYLPATLLPAQEAKLAEQKAAADAAIQAESEEWSNKKEELKKAIEETEAREPIVQSELAALRKQKLDLATSDHPTPSPAPAPAPSTNGARPGSVKSESVPPSSVPQQQIKKETDDDESAPTGDAVMDGDEDVEY